MKNYTEKQKEAFEKLKKVGYNEAEIQSLLELYNSFDADDMNILLNEYSNPERCGVCGLNDGENYAYRWINDEDEILCQVGTDYTISNKDVIATLEDENAGRYDWIINIIKFADGLASDTIIDGIALDSKYDRMLHPIKQLWEAAQDYGYTLADIEAMIKINEHLGEDISSLTYGIYDGTIRTRKDCKGRIYAYYSDGIDALLCDAETLDIIDDEDTIEKMFC